MLDELIMTEYIAAVAILWVVVGLWLVINSQSRGWKADAAFILFWPVHVYFEILRR